MLKNIEKEPKIGNLKYGIIELSLGDLKHFIIDGRIKKEECIKYSKEDTEEGKSYWLDKAKKFERWANQHTVKIKKYEALINKCRREIRFCLSQVSHLLHIQKEWNLFKKQKKYCCFACFGMRDDK